jgi:hypothetical protein
VLVWASSTRTPQQWKVLTSILENKDNNNFIVDIVSCILKKNVFFIIGESKQARGSLVKKSPSLAQMDVVVMCPHASPHTNTINVTTTPSNVSKSLKYDGAMIVASGHGVTIVISSFGVG